MDHETLVNHLHTLANSALSLWDLQPGSTATLINLSENATYRVDQPDAESVILRVHRENYHTENAIRCELDWMAALRDFGVITPRTIAGLNGSVIQQTQLAELTSPRHLVMFELIPGSEPDETQDLIQPFGQLGEITAQLHNQSQQYQRPTHFERLIWDYDHILGQQPNWGDWRKAPAMDQTARAVLQRQQDTIQQRLTAFGQGPERYSLIHADLRLANLLIDDTGIRVIDFDDCGMGWYLYDYATALSFIEDHPQVPELTTAWLEGYRRHRVLSSADEAELPTFLMLRRMALLAWIGSHSETDLAQEQGPEFTRVSCELAEDYLNRFA